MLSSSVEDGVLDTEPSPQSLALCLMEPLVPCTQTDTQSPARPVSIFSEVLLNQVIRVPTFCPSVLPPSTHPPMSQPPRTLHAPITHPSIHPSSSITYSSIHRSIHSSIHTGCQGTPTSSISDKVSLVTGCGPIAQTGMLRLRHRKGPWSLRASLSCWESWCLMSCHGLVVPSGPILKSQALPAADLSHRPYRPSTGLVTSRPETAT